MLFSKERTKTANKKRHRIRMCGWAFNRLIQLVLFLNFLIHAIKIASDINLLSLRYFLVPERAIHPLFQNRSDSESNKHQTKYFTILQKVTHHLPHSIHINPVLTSIHRLRFLQRIKYTTSQNILPMTPIIINLLPHNSSVVSNQTAPDPSALPPSPAFSDTALSPEPASDDRPTATKIASDLSQTFIYPHPHKHPLHTTESPSPPCSEASNASESTKSASTASHHPFLPLLPANPPIPAGNPDETRAPTGGTACAPTRLRHLRAAPAGARETPRKRPKTTAQASGTRRGSRIPPSIPRIYVTKPDRHDGTWPVRRWSRLSPRPQRSQCGPRGGFDSSRQKIGVFSSVVN